MGCLGFVSIWRTRGYLSTGIVPPRCARADLVPSFIILAQFMPKRTDKGATAAAKWNAFKRYLSNIEKYTNVAEAKDLFDKFLPYAIAFGLEHSWVNKFAAGGYSGAARGTIRTAGTAMVVPMAAASTPPVPRPQAAAMGVVCLHSTKHPRQGFAVSTR